MNRNSNIGETGANMNKSMFRRFLKAMTWATEATSSFGDLSYLLLPQYTAHMQVLHLPDTSNLQAADSLQAAFVTDVM